MGQGERALLFDSSFLKRHVFLTTGAYGWGRRQQRGKGKVQDQHIMEKPIGLAMVIDDEAVDRLVSERALKRSGLVERIICFGAARDALEFLQGPESPMVDVLFLDVNMPQMNGVEFLEQARATLGRDVINTCVVMLTTEPGAGHRAQLAQFEIVRAFASKPLTLEQVQDVAAGLSKAVA